MVPVASTSYLMKLYNPPFYSCSDGHVHIFGLTKQIQTDIFILN
jgi:hypothetical protein